MVTFGPGICVWGTMRMIRQHILLYVANNVHSPVLAICQIADILNIDVQESLLLNSITTQS